MARVPGVKDGQDTKARAQKLGIGRQLLQSIGGGLHQQAIDFLRMGSCEWAELGGQSEGHQKVGTRRKAAALLFNPAFRLCLGTLRTGAVAAGVIREDFLLAMTALVDVASQLRCPARGDIPQSPFLNRTQRASILPEIRLTVEADDLGHLQHEDPGFRGPSSAH